MGAYYGHLNTRQVNRKVFIYLYYKCTQYTSVWCNTNFKSWQIILNLHIDYTLIKKKHIQISCKIERNKGNIETINTNIHDRSKSSHVKKDSVCFQSFIFNVFYEDCSFLSIFQLGDTRSLTRSLTQIYVFPEANCRKIWVCTFTAFMFKNIWFDHPFCKLTKQHITIRKYTYWRLQFKISDTSKWVHVEHLPSFPPLFCTLISNKLGNPVRR